MDSVARWCDTELLATFCLTLDLASFPEVVDLFSCNTCDSDKKVRGRPGYLTCWFYILNHIVLEFNEFVMLYERARPPRSK